MAEEKKVEETPQGLDPKFLQGLVFKGAKPKAGT